MKKRDIGKIRECKIACKKCQRDFGSEKEVFEIKIVVINRENEKFQNIEKIAQVLGITTGGAAVVFVVCVVTPVDVVTPSGDVVVSFGDFVIGLIITVAFVMVVGGVGVGRLSIVYSIDIKYKLHVRATLYACYSVI